MVFDFEIYLLRSKRVYFFMLWLSKDGFFSELVLCEFFITLPVGVHCLWSGSTLELHNSMTVPEFERQYMKGEVPIHEIIACISRLRQSAGPRHYNSYFFKTHPLLLEVMD